MKTIFNNGAFHNQEQNQVNGYMHPLYAASLAEFGKCLELSASGGWILERAIPSTTYRDAMGFYPIFSCRDWTQLPVDLTKLEGMLVSLALVTDPFGNFQVNELAHIFDVFYQYKQHFVADLSKPIEKIVSKGHRKLARRSLKVLVVEQHDNPSNFVDEWCLLYDSLINKHNIQGIRKFSRAAFESQLRIPGTVYFRVLSNGNPVGGNIFIVQGDVAYGHLSAFSDEGYLLGAAYAVKWIAIQYFMGKVNWMSLGAGAGINQNSAKGLEIFKKGWSTGMLPAYFCGRILDHNRYFELANTCAYPDSTYFPIYRTGEFG